MRNLYPDTVYYGNIQAKVSGRLDGWMDGWITYDFTSFSTVFQSYQDDERVIMKCCVQGNPRLKR